MEREAAWDLRVPRLSGVNLKSLHVASFWLVGIEFLIAFAVAFESPCKTAEVFQVFGGGASWRTRPAVQQARLR